MLTTLILNFFRKVKNVDYIDFELFSKNLKMLTTLILNFFRKVKNVDYIDLELPFKKIILETSWNPVGPFQSASRKTLVR
jgi:3-dehydroquinate dehydratase